MPFLSGNLLAGGSGDEMYRAEVRASMPNLIAELGS
jgi:hypothetical protein